MVGSSTCYVHHFFESLILAQDERWRCALSMQVERYVRAQAPNVQLQTGEYNIGIYPLAGNNLAKAGLIPHEIAR